jgi:hypothetical protein
VTRYFFTCWFFCFFQSVWAEKIGGREQECSSQDWSLSAYRSIENGICSQEIKYKVKYDFEVLKSKDL